MGTVINGFTVYLPYLRDQFGFSNTQTSLLVDLRCATAFVGMFIVGVYYTKLSLRTGTGIAAFLVFLAFLIYSFSGNHYLLYAIGAAVSGFGYGLGSMIPLSLLMNNWFSDCLSLAIGISASGSGLATIILPPVIARMIEHHSIRFSFFVQAIVTLVITIIIVLLIRDYPRDLCLKRYKKSAQTKASKKTNMPPQIILKRIPTIRSSKNVWIYLVIASFIMGILANPAFSHLPMLFTEAGCAPKTAALLVSLVGLVLTLSKIIFGRITDKIGIYYAFMIFGFIAFIGLVCLSLIHTGIMLFIMIGGIMVGLGFSTATIAIPCWAVDYANEKNYPKVLRTLEILYALGALIFTGMPGVLADITGSYVIAYIVFSLCIATAMIMVRLSYTTPNT